VKPAIGFTLPSAGLSPAPSEKVKNKKGKYESQNGDNALSLSGSGGDVGRKLPILSASGPPFRVGKGVRGIGRRDSDELSGSPSHYGKGVGVRLQASTNTS
jgi:hypothetical protein